MIALKVPECIRWLCLLYVSIGLIGVLMISYVCVHNRRVEREIMMESLRLEENLNGDGVVKLKMKEI